jgi:Meckel syndrome type 1 protein
MSRRTLLTLAFSACCALMLACSGADNANHSNANVANANRAAATNATTTTTPATTTSPAASTSAATGDKIGVAECDDYLAKVDTCVTSKVPAAARAQYTASIEQTRKSWRDLAANPQTKASLASACKQAVEAARTAYKSYGCEF